MIANGMTRTPTATPNGNQGGAGALAGCVKIVTAANVALSAAGCACALDAGTFAPSMGLALAVVVSALMLAWGGAR